VKALLVTALLLASSSAVHAESVGDLTRTARSLARQGHCASMQTVGDRVRAIDDDYYRQVFSVDPVIRACSQLAVPDPTDAGAGAGKDHLKSGDTALALSAGVFAGGVLALVLATKTQSAEQVTTLALAGLAGIAIGPTLGHAYAGDTWNTGLQIRLASVAVGAVGVVVIAKSCPPFGSCPDPGSGDLGAAMVLGGMIGLAVGTVYEIVDARGAATRANHRHLQLVPTVGSGVAGASLTGRF